MGHASDRYKRSYKETRRDSIGLGVYNSGMEQCASGYKWGPGVRDHYLLHYISAGRGVYSSPCGEWTLEAGSVFLAYPNTVIAYQADCQEPWAYSWVGFHGADSHHLLHHTGFSRENPVWQSGLDPSLERAIAAIYGVRGLEIAHDAAMTGRLYMLLSLLIQRHPALAHGRSQSRIYFENSIRIIAQGLGEEMTVQDIADAVGLSRSQLYRVFTAQAGMSPIEFLNKYRMDRAAELLREDKLTVAQAAASVGYADPLYFSRMFKKMKGIPPGRYRGSGDSGPPDGGNAG